jgi:hypothetical protein
MTPETQKTVETARQMPATATRKGLSTAESGNDERRGKEARGLSAVGPPKYYDTDGAAKYLRCTPGHIRKLVQLKKLKPRKTEGKGLSFTQAALDRYKKVRRRAGRPIGSGEIKLSEEKREWWRKYMRDRRMGKPPRRASASKTKKTGGKVKAAVKKRAVSKTATGGKKKSSVRR